jgi:hypothetical protein
VTASASHNGGDPGGGINPERRGDPGGGGNLERRGDPAKGVNTQRREAVGDRSGDHLLPGIVSCRGEVDTGTTRSTNGDGSLGVRRMKTPSAVNMLAVELRTASASHSGGDVDVGGSGDLGSKCD